MALRRWVSSRTMRGDRLDGSRLTHNPRGRRFKSCPAIKVEGPIPNRESTLNLYLCTGRCPVTRIGRRPRPPAWCRLPEPVLPSFPPGEVPYGKVFQRRTADEMIQGPPSSNVPHDQNPLPVPAQRQRPRP